MRDDFERLLYWLDYWLSCILDCIHVCVFFTLEKLVFKKWLDTSSIPPQHLAVCRDSSAVSYRFPDRSSIPGGSIEKAPASLIDPWYLVDRSSFCSWIWWVVPQYLLDTSVIDKHFLDTYLDTFRHLICRDLLRVLYKPPCAIQTSFHSISLSIALCFLSQTLSSHSNLDPQRFLKAFSRFSSLGKLLISHSSCISCFKT